MNEPENTGDGRTPRPVLRVIRGDATPEEIAAVLAVVAARVAATSARAASEPPAQPSSTWTARGPVQRGIRASFARGSDGWRTSFWPR